MKRIFKWSLILFGIIIAVSIGASINSDDVTQNSSEPASTEVKEDKEKQKSKKPGKISKEEYEAIVVGDSLTGKGGMSIEEAIEKFGEPNTRTESQSGDLKMEMLSWNAEGDFGANVTITFTNGYASGKSNFGLK